ncbi:MAG TPA: hypothetical protein VN282_20700 [Pyrinomonadaceae bacterium]|nr:hypothetical protein [Pyrinomonadaceae bacterium]
MGEFGRWLLHEDQKEVFNYLFAVVLNAVFVALAALLLWPAGKAATALTLARGFWALWTALIISGALVVLLQRLFRVDMYSHGDAYIVSGLVVGGLHQAGWSAFAALAAREAAAGAPLWLAAVLYFVGLLSCLVALHVVSAFYMGSIYRMTNLIVAAASLLLFCVWPAAARTLFGWFFDFYGRFLDPYGWFSGLFTLPPSL